MGLINWFLDDRPLEQRDTWKRPPWPMLEDVKEISIAIGRPVPINPPEK